METDPYFMIYLVTKLYAIPLLDTRKIYLTTLNKMYSFLKKNIPDCVLPPKRVLKKSRQTNDIE